VLQGAAVCRERPCEIHINMSYAGLPTVTDVNCAPETAVDCALENDAVCSCASACKVCRLAATPTTLGADASSGAGTDGEV